MSFSRAPLKNTVRWYGFPNKILLLLCHFDGLDWQTLILACRNGHASLLKCLSHVWGFYIFVSNVWILLRKNVTYHVIRKVYLHRFFHCQIWPSYRKRCQFKDTFEKKQCLQQRIIRGRRIIRCCKNNELYVFLVISCMCTIMKGIFAFKNIPNSYVVYALSTLYPSLLRHHYR